jgi:hypothetical protein
VRQDPRYPFEYGRTESVRSRQASVSDVGATS